MHSAPLYEAVPIAAGGYFLHCGEHYNGVYVPLFILKLRMLHTDSYR